MENGKKQLLKVEIKKYGLNYVATYLDFIFYFNGLRAKSDSIEAKIKILQEGKKLLFLGKAELMNVDYRWKLAKHLEIMKKNINWLEILTIVFTKIANEVLRHEPPQTLKKVMQQNHYWLYPLLADPFTLIFAPGGSGKSYLALYLAMMLQTGVEDLVLDTSDPVNVLYLDWETSFEDVSKRFTKLSNTADDTEWQSPYYRNLSFPLSYMYDVILEDIMKYDIGLIIIDSVVPAMGGNINNADGVGEFFSMLKQFYHVNNTRTLLLTHISKHDKKEEGNKSPIGSVYFENYPRLVWELKSVSSKNKLNIELVPYKSNVPMPKPLGFIFEFLEDRILVSSGELENTNELEQYILQLLTTSGEMKLKDIKDTLRKEFGTTSDEVRRMLYKLSKSGVIYQPRYGYYAIQSSSESEIPF